MPSSAYLTTYLGWRITFYVFGGLGVLWCVVWWITVRSSPDKDRFISEDELQYIQSTVDVEQKTKRVVPWKSFLTSKPIWAITVAQVSLNWGDNLMLTQMPTFLDDAFNFDLGSSGILSAAPYLTKGILISIAGYLADMLLHRRTLTITQIRKLWICGASVVQTICMTLVGVFIHPLWSVILLIVGVGTGGVCVSGYSGNALDVAPDFASVILGFSNTFSCLTGIVSPILTGYLVPNQTVDEWRVVFYITGGIHVLGAVVYGFWGSGQLQPLSHVQRSPKDEKSP